MSSTRVGPRRILGLCPPPAGRCHPHEALVSNFGLPTPPGLANVIPLDNLSPASAGSHSATGPSGAGTSGAGSSSTASEAAVSRAICGHLSSDCYPSTNLETEGKGDDGTEEGKDCETVWRFGGRESIFKIRHTNEFCGKSMLDRETARYDHLFPMIIVLSTPKTVHPGSILHQIGGVVASPIGWYIALDRRRNFKHRYWPWEFLGYEDISQQDVVLPTIELPKCPLPLPRELQHRCRPQALSTHPSTLQSERQG
ncbi:uncharacterized protein B0J16DRAFT_381658 [Fusarium flagelliforme]|uniref:uncharacterized protein n=1 Tax=Fusarium flagelliforme TaxID=2675880 RepID=UPI001E8E5C72|nr:uncharacterized protein B0J16DRAFT_381658 [Fusarium flagelliforme]KAH7193782.1 hypothetical protein B0J16DRAFT_381658 [Fusarium flagelliforme]